MSSCCSTSSCDGAPRDDCPRWSSCASSDLRATPESRPAHGQPWPETWSEPDSWGYGCMPLAWDRTGSIKSTTALELAIRSWTRPDRSDVCASWPRPGSASSEVGDLQRAGPARNREYVKFVAPERGSVCIFSEFADAVQVESGAGRGQEMDGTRSGNKRGSWAA